jgi:hypothetical protein
MSAARGCKSESKLAKSPHWWMQLLPLEQAKNTVSNTVGRDDNNTYSRCLANLRWTDPRDKKRIEYIKSGLLEGSYKWILDHPDARKGKVMLLIGIINELV